jgi:hypothetical protein
MTKEQLIQGNALQDTVNRMKVIEDFLRNGKLDVVQFQKIPDNGAVRGATMVIQTDTEADFVIQEIVKAGLFAAQMILKNAEIELGKL